MHRKDKIFFMHDTGDHYPKDVCDHERHGDISEQAMQFADRAFRLLSACLRKPPVLGFFAVCDHRQKTPGAGLMAPTA
jgi:hypothetical protein